MVHTFRDMIEGCRRRDAQSWREFVTGYLPLARHFLLQYFPGLSGPNASGNVERLLPGVFAGTLDDDGSFFRSFTGRAEREFMVHFRRYVLGRGRTLAELPAPAAPPVTLEVLEAALKEFSALQRQVAWLFMLGYPPDTVAPILNRKEGTTAEVVRTAQERLRTAMESWSEESLRSSGPALVEAVASRESQDCYPYLTVHRIVDGQISWRDRERILNHLAACFFCVERFCTFQEVVYFSRKSPAPSETETEAVLAALNLPSPAKKKSLLAKLFG